MRVSLLEDGKIRIAVMIIFLGYACFFLDALLILFSLGPLQLRNDINLLIPIPGLLLVGVGCIALFIRGRTLQRRSGEE